MALCSKVSNFSLGPPGNVPTSQLSINRDVNCARVILSEQGITRANNFRNIVFKPVTTKVIERWTGEGIPIMLTIGVQRKVLDCYKTFQKMSKVENYERVDNALRLKQMEQFFGELFDIAICGCRELRHCKCPREHRVPDAKKRFLRDQRCARSMFLARRN